ncbi:hypothetical protein, partial [Chengkuizengella marina]
MVMFKKNTLFHFMIGLMLLVVLILFSIFSSTEVHAQEREGYEMVDYGTHKVYFPKPVIQSTTKSSSGTVSTTTGEVSEESKKDLPELNIEGLRSLSDLPTSTYENRTINHGLQVEGVAYIPVDFKVGNAYPSDLFLSELNDALNAKDPFVDTFIGVYNEETKMVSNYFPINPPDTLTLLLNKNSYYAKGLTLDVEEWWETSNYGDSNGSKVTQSITRTTGVDNETATSAVITHGTEIEVNWSVKAKAEFGFGAFEWEVGNRYQYNYANTQESSFARTYHSSISETFTASFGELIEGHPYVWAVYDLVTRTKVNYAQAQNFKQLDNDLRNVKDFGLTPHMSSHMVQIYNKIYSTKEIPIFDEDTNLAKPNNLTASPDFQNLTITLNWDPVPADQMAQSPVDDDKVNNGKVAGYYVYKNDVIVATIFDPTRTQ